MKLFPSVVSIGALVVGAISYKVVLNICGSLGVVLLNHPVRLFDVLECRGDVLPVLLDPLLLHHAVLWASFPAVLLVRNLISLDRLDLVGGAVFHLNLCLHEVAHSLLAHACISLSRNHWTRMTLGVAFKEGVVMSIIVARIAVA